MDEDILGVGLWDMGSYIPNTGSNNGPGTVTVGALDNATLTNGGDAWGGFWSGLGNVAGKVIDYGIAKDAAQNGVRYQTAANGQPVYAPAPNYYQPQYMAQGGGINGNTMLIGGALVLGLVVVLVAGKN